MEEKNNSITNNLEENRHHIFKKNEVKCKMIEIFGEPKTEEDYALIEREVKWCWFHLPRYKLPIFKHRLIHILQNSKPRQLKYVVIDFDEKIKKIKNNGEELRKCKEKIIELTNNLVFERNRNKQLNIKIKQYIN